jgi:hypothetical protein
MGIQGAYRKFEENEDTDFIKMRMVEIWEAEEKMEGGGSEKGNPPTFLESATKRTEATCL